MLCPLLLLAAHYSYSMSYPTGLKTVYALFEYIILDIKPQQMPSVLGQFTTYLIATKVHMQPRMICKNTLQTFNYNCNIM